MCLALRIPVCVDSSSKRIVQPGEVLLTFTPEVYLSDVVDHYMYSVSPRPGCTPTIRSGPAQEQYGSGLREVAADSLVDRAAKDHLSKSELLQNCLPTVSAASCKRGREGGGGGGVEGDERCFSMFCHRIVETRVGIRNVGGSLGVA